MDGDAHPVRKCPETGANVNAFLDLNHLAALMIAWISGDWDVSRVFVEDFDADLDGPVSRAGTRAINYAGYQGHCFPVGHPICEYLKSEGSQHAWWEAVNAQDFKRVEEYVDNGQDIDEINPVLWSANAILVAQESGTNRIASYLLSRGWLLRRVRAGVSKEAPFEHVGIMHGQLEDGSVVTNRDHCVRQLRPTRPDVLAFVSRLKRAASAPTVLDTEGLHRL